MNKLLLIITALVWTSGSLAMAQDSVESVVVNPSVVCSSQSGEGFLAISVSENRIWVGPEYDPQAETEGLELQNVELKADSQGYKYSAELQMTWGRQVTRVRYEGVINFVDSKKATGLQTATVLIGKDQGPVTASLECVRY
ncbi:MAG: hypothetical protein IT289_02370 [Oligoflexia bacterium]|nr:hypothetical protein [Oligoflexia bacterium]